MTKKLEDVMDSLPPKRREEIERRRKELRAMLDEAKAGDLKNGLAESMHRC